MLLLMNAANPNGRTLRGWSQCRHCLSEIDRGVAQIVISIQWCPFSVQNTRWRCRLMMRMWCTTGGYVIGTIDGDGHSTAIWC